MQVNKAGRDEGLLPFSNIRGTVTTPYCGKGIIYGKVHDGPDVYPGKRLTCCLL